MGGGMNNGLRKLTSWVFSYWILQSFSHALNFEWGKSNKPFEAAKMELVEMAEQGKNGYILRLSFPFYNWSKGDFFTSELYLSFDEARRNFEEKAVILQGQFERERFSNSVREAAIFRHTYQGITIKSMKSFFLNDKINIGSFSLYFLVKPFDHRGKMVLFKKIGYYSGKKYGLEVSIEKGILTCYFHNLWERQDGQRLSFALKSREALSLYQIQPVLLVYDEAKNQVFLYLDGKEQEVLFTKEGFSEEGTPLVFKNHPADNSLIFLGYGFLGVIDEFLITQRVLPADFSLNRFASVPTENLEPLEPGRFLSKVYDIGYSQSEIEDIKSQGQIPEGTAMKIYLRTSNKPFLPDTPEDLLPFVMVSGKKKFFGRYFQYRVDFYTDVTGSKTPVLEELTLLAKPNLPPKPPKGLTVEEVGEDFVTLSFFRNPERDVLDGGRYHIYYGIKPYEPLGVIRYAQVELSSFGAATKTINDKEHRFITSDPRKQNRLIFRVNNEVITQNLLYTRYKPNFKLSYPLLLKNRPYYFWVTACDNAYQESLEFLDHESSPSEAVLVRLEGP